MTRRESRTAAFCMIYEKDLNGNELPEIVSCCKEAESYESDDYSLRLANAVYDNLDAIDAMISKNLVDWTLARLPKTALALLRLSCAEMLYIDEVPESISINEAVEIAKVYCAEKDYQFINGVLGSIARELEEKKCTASE